MSDRPPSDVAQLGPGDEDERPRLTLPRASAVMRHAGVIRLVIIVGGGLVVLQSSQGLEASKLAYLVLASIVFALSLRSVWRRRHLGLFDAARPWFVMSAVLIALIAISFPVSIARGTPISQWIRDAATYGLFAAAPVFAVDAAASMRRGLLLALTIVFGSLGALSFGINWITLRNLAALPVDQLVLPTASLPTVLFLVSLAAAILDQRRRPAWILLGGATLGIFLLSGTRSALLVLVAMPVIVVLAGRPRWRHAASASVGVTLVAAVLVLSVQAAFVSASRELPPPIDVATPNETPPAGSGASAIPTGGGQPGPTSSPARSPGPPPPNPDANLLRRIQDFLASPQRDGSVRERLVQYGVAWDLFMSSPLVGVGLGHPFEWKRLDGSTMADFTADTPLVLPAKLGILGLAWLVGLAAVWLGLVRRLHRTGPTIPGLVMAGWTAVVVALAWTGFNVEDKGFSFALIVVLASGFSELEARRSADP